MGTLARPGQKCYQRLTLCLVGGYGRVLDAAGMSEVGTGIRTRMKVRKQNESGTFPDSFFILEESVRTPVFQSAQIQDHEYRGQSIACGQSTKEGCSD